MKAIHAWLVAGGPLLPIIGLTALVLYALISARFLGQLGRSQDSGQTRDGEHESTRQMALIQVLIAVLPLLGLLGTVHGIIVAFAGLEAGDPVQGAGTGISQALLATQYGLAAAIPGLMAEWHLRRRRDIQRLSADRAGRSRA